MSAVWPLPVPRFAPGRRVELPGRGVTFVRELPGPHGAPVILLLHGWTATAGMNWFTSMRRLSRSFRVVAIDHRGHGRGIRSDEPFTLEACADDAAALLEVLGVERALVAGYSMGGPIAQLLWRRHRDRVAGLILCSTCTTFPIRVPLVYPLGMLAKGAAWLPGRIAQERNLPIVGSVPQLGLLDELGRGDARALLEAGVCISRFDSRRWIGEVDVPTAVVVTTADELVSPRLQQEMARSIPGASLHTVAGSHLACGTSAREWVPVFERACLDVSGRVSAAAPQRSRGGRRTTAAVVAYGGAAPHRRAGERDDDGAAVAPVLQLASATPRSRARRGTRPGSR